MTAHTLHKCSAWCTGCHYCNGGIAFCDVCKGGEVELPTQCPGRPMTDEERAAVTLGTRDFTGGKWIGREKKAQQAAQSRAVVSTPKD